MNKMQLKKLRIKECLKLLVKFGATNIENEGSYFHFEIKVDINGDRVIETYGSFNRYGGVYIDGEGDMGDGFSPDEYENNYWINDMSNKIQRQIDRIWESYTDLK